MKIIDRVIFCLNNNENYIDFWNYISKVYKLKFDIIPTLAFNGTEEEYENLKNRLSTQYGEIIFYPRIIGIDYDKNLDWTCTWSLFKTASLYENEICMLSGIDQIPLSGIFFQEIKKLNPYENYIIGFSDAYNETVKNIFGDIVYPSSHHVGMGKLYKKIYEIEDTWNDELSKVNTYRHMCTCQSCWGMDELYSSHMIKKYMTNNSNIIFVKNFSERWQKNRIDRSSGKIKVTQDLLNRISKDEFTEYHSIRPFSLNQNMNLIFDHINKQENYI